MNDIGQKKFDKTNAIIAGGVFLVAFVVYALTVQRTFSFWDCGEFVACSYILGIPHPPGTPLFVLFGKLFSLIPFVSDVSYRINYISVISSALTAMLSYLLIVKIVGYFFSKTEENNLTKFIGYIGGIAGAFFVAFSRTNWGNSVEAEVYGMSLAISVLLLWLTLRYVETRGTATGFKLMVFTFYLAMLGVGIHMTTFLVVPICALFFVLNEKATNRDWLVVCGYVMAEMLLILLIAMGQGTLEGKMRLFYIISAVLGLGLFAFIFRKINWAILIAIGTVCSVMISFSLYLQVSIAATAILIIIGIISRTKPIPFQWKAALMIVVVAFLGFSVHFYIPIRSELNPRIDENNPSRDWRTFVNYLDRKQYGQISMVERMFNRRGLLENQFGRHPHMGFWSFFEEQYSERGNQFLPFLALGLIGLVVAIRKRFEVGLPLLTLLLICSVGLILYMNFADGTQYDATTRDAYLEVRDRDYFFTPAFVFFGIAMGIGVSSLMTLIKERFVSADGMKGKPLVYAAAVLVLLPAVSFSHNYYASDRSQNYLSINYAKNILDSCEENALLFTAGDNDTFPVWALQEVYDYRKDVVVVNLSLLNTDWYVEQMKNRYDVPISLTEDQILWYPIEISRGRETYTIDQPKERFNDRPRRRMEYLKPNAYANQLVRVQDMMMDEIVLENKFKRPIYFSTPPYDSPLKLAERTQLVGMIYKLERDTSVAPVNIERSYDLYMNTYNFDGMQDSKVYRDENATGVYIGLGSGMVRLFDAMVNDGQVERAKILADSMMNRYPEYWQMYMLVASQYEKEGDSATAMTMMRQLHDTLTVFLDKNEGNLFYRQDLGLIKTEIGRRTGDQPLIDEGINLMWEAFNDNPNSAFAFRKLVTGLSQQGRYDEIGLAAQKIAQYKINLEDPFIRQLMGMSP